NAASASASPAAGVAIHSMQLPKAPPTAPAAAPPSAPARAPRKEASRKPRAEPALASRVAIERSNVQRVQRIHQLVEVVLWPLRFVGLPFGDADAHAHCLPAVADQLPIAFVRGNLKSVATAEQFAQVDLERTDGSDGCACDGRRLVVGEHDG